MSAAGLDVVMGIVRQLLDAVDHHAKVLEDHDGALVKDANRLDALAERIRKLEWREDKPPATDAVKALTKRLDVLDTWANKVLVGLSDRVRALEYPEDNTSPISTWRSSVSPAEPAVPGVVHDNLVSQLAIALWRLDKVDAQDTETIYLPEFIAGARWMLAVARNARP
jgi:hypothetical protein